MAGMSKPANIDLDDLREQLQGMLQEGRDEDIVMAVLELVGKLTSENERLAEKLAGLMRGRAHGGSERIPAEQLALFMAQLGEPTTEQLADGDVDAELEDDEDDEDDASEDTEADKPPAKKRKRVRVVGVVERSTQISDPSPDELVCPDCGRDKSPATPAVCWWRSNRPGSASSTSSATSTRAETVSTPIWSSAQLHRRRWRAES